MTEILPGIHLVDHLTDSPDFTTHVYLLKDQGPTWTLIDTGLPGKAPVLEAYFAEHQISPRSIRKILITHLHRDHTGNLRAMAELTQAKTYAHWIEAAYIAGNPPYDGPGTPPKEPVVVDVEFKDGDLIDAAGGLVAYHTPGHTPGHTSYYHPERKILFCGDLIFPNFTLTDSEYSIHVPTAQISARRVSRLPLDSVLSYHGGPYLKEPSALFQKLLRTF
ncbi:MAG: MBL fold metallo-hydrolase [Thermoplasmata archaeon]|nr:MBL fold metallo-hydrolase [Thermoplasmata archaeon]